MHDLCSHTHLVPPLCSFTNHLAFNVPFLQPCIFPTWTYRISNVALIFALSFLDSFNTCFLSLLLLSIMEIFVLQDGLNLCWGHILGSCGSPWLWLWSQMLVWIPGWTWSWSAAPRTLVVFSQALLALPWLFTWLCSHHHLNISPKTLPPNPVLLWGLVIYFWCCWLLQAQPQEQEAGHKTYIQQVSLTSSARNRSFWRKFWACFSLSRIVVFLTWDRRILACWPIVSYMM